MKAVVPVSVALLCHAASGQSFFVFDLEGTQIPALPDDPVALEYFVPFHGYLEFLDFNIDLTMNDPSWGSEFNLEMSHPESGYALTFDGSDGNPGDLGPADIDLGFGDAPGFWHAAGGVDTSGSGVYDVHGIWTITIFDELDSLPGPDGSLGGTLTIGVPAPPRPCRSSSPSSPHAGAERRVCVTDDDRGSRTKTGPTVR